MALHAQLKWLLLLEMLGPQVQWPEIHPNVRAASQGREAVKYGRRVAMRWRNGTGTAVGRRWRNPERRSRLPRRRLPRVG